MSLVKSHIDFETASQAELARQNAVGEHAYAAHSSTVPLLLAFKTSAMCDVGLIDLTKDTTFPKDIEWAIRNGETFVAHNARFEQAIWYWQMQRKFGWPVIPKWSCTAARARYWGIRASLEGAASDLEVPHQKNKRGEELIKLFCKPRKKTKGRIVLDRALPHELPSEWEEFKYYCVDDVLAEMDVDAVLPDLPEFEQRIWDLDYTINWRGLPIDAELVDRATMFCDYYTALNVARFEAITGGLAPTQRDKVLAYVQERELSIDNLRSKTLKRLNMADMPADLREIIAIRLEAAKASVKKLQAMSRCTTDDGVARGLLLYYGAHTGRHSGKRVQPQNFVRGNAKVQKAVFAYLEDDGIWDHTHYLSNSGISTPPWVYDADLMFPRPLGALAQSMRGFIKAPKGKRFVVADYAQIEARINAWLAGAENKLDMFRKGVDLYCMFATSMYGTTYDSYFDPETKKPFKAGPRADERQIAKSAELGCGFGLGGTAFVAYCDNMDIVISEAEAKNVVKTWRDNNKEITTFWERVEKAAIIATTFEDRKVKVGEHIAFRVYRKDTERWWLECILPSGRHIAYYRPKVEDIVRWGQPAKRLSFRTEWNGMTYREDTYGGKLVENIVQGTARDVMMVGIQNAEKNGYECVLTVHDENVTLRDIGHGSSRELESLMCDLPAWIGSCPIIAEGSELERYGK